MGAAQCYTRCQVDGPDGGEFILDRATVYLNIYDLNEDWVSANHVSADILQLGGAFHAGVEVYGVEWTYGAEGVRYNEPRRHDVHIYRQSLELGVTLRTEKQVKSFIENAMIPRWQASDYDLLSHNCCSFADALCRHLCGQALPGWVNRFSRLASSANGGLDRIANLRDAVSSPRDEKCFRDQEKVRFMRTHSMESDTTQLSSDLGSELEVASPRSVTGRYE
eukprot:TRINITY_DN96343_c0_g1_i1.p1 TRINITY_DN96343_c0_g1~~TRINITY_DN96343_c0_g1_i1.p1  ORF type:complete len:222 (+),score=34.06 TRINITY_DN96343_c0_g1_i1:62-727(+)